MQINWLTSYARGDLGTPVCRWPSRARCATTRFAVVAGRSGGNGSNGVRRPCADRPARAGGAGTNADPPWDSLRWPPRRQDRPSNIR